MTSEINLWKNFYVKYNHFDYKFDSNLRRFAHHPKYNKNMDEIGELNCCVYIEIKMMSK